jgi:hypothetical protein
VSRIFEIFKVQSAVQMWGNNLQWVFEFSRLILVSKMIFQNNAEFDKKKETYIKETII